MTIRPKQGNPSSDMKRESVEILSVHENSSFVVNKSRTTIVIRMMRNTGRKQETEPDGRKYFIAWETLKKAGYSKVNSRKK